VDVTESGEELILKGEADGRRVYKQLLCNETVIISKRLLTIKSCASMMKYFVAEYENVCILCNVFRASTPLPSLCVVET